MSQKTFELRQQLTSDSLMILLNAANIQIENLKKLHWQVCTVTKDPEAFKKIADEITKLEEAKSQLSNLYVDQFPEGREQNDKNGHTGISLSQPKKKKAKP